MKESTSLSIDSVLDMKIKDIDSDFHHKGLVFVAPSTPIINTALFLIPLRELFVSGIVVVNEGKPIGKIGPKHILQKVVEIGYQQCMMLHAQDFMVDLGIGPMTEDNDVSYFLRIFNDTNFGFSPIIQNGKLIGNISTRYFLPLISQMRIEEPVSTIANDLIFVSQGISIENTLRIMIKEKIRKMAIKYDGRIKIVDDRALLQFLFSLEKNKPNILDTHIDYLPKSHLATISPDMTISKTAEFLINQDEPCVVFDDKIVTPWDIVMKVLWSYTTRTDVNKITSHFN